jgi:hypothetical protein
MPKRDYLAGVIEDDGAVAEAIWDLGNPGLLDRLLVVVGFGGDLFSTKQTYGRPRSPTCRAAVPFEGMLST